MDRREFLLLAARYGLAAAASLSGLARVFGSTAPPTESRLQSGLPTGNDDSQGRHRVALDLPQLVAVKGAAGSATRLDTAEKLFIAGIAALGGMGRFVARGETVVVKPNIGWDVGPERAANTNPLLVKAIVEACLVAGAKRVYVFDHSCDAWKACYRSSGIEEAARAAGATVAPGGSESYYQRIEVRGATKLTTIKIHELVLQSECLINVPVLKSHGGAGMTCALKNLMGTVWDREAFHFQGLDRSIAESALAIKPRLTIVDACRIMMTGGPRGHGGSRYADLGMQILGSDLVAVDAAAAKTFGSNAGAFPYIGMAAALGLGTTALDTLDIRRIAL